jgi:O-antigen/teichoic acid export membrane protein
VKARVQSPPDPTPPPSETLTHPGLLARNALVNLVGLVLPSLAALWAVPLLISGYGTDRFALLTLAWLIIGHASVFDLGMGRALTRALADKLGRGDEDGLVPTVWTALAAIGVIGIVVAMVMVALAPWLGRDLLQVPAGFEADAVSGFRWLAVGMPAVVLTAALRGVLEAQQRFDLVTILRVPGGVLMFVGPLAALLFSVRFDVAVIVLVVIRTAVTAAYFIACLYTLPALRGRVRMAREELRALLGFGGWVTVGGSVSMAMDYVTRFSIGALLPVAFVAYYATPADILVKLLVVPTAILGVLFPAIAVHAASDLRRAAVLIDRGARMILLLMVPATVVLVAVAHELLAWWIDPGFADASAGALRWLAFGGLITGVASVPVGALAGINRPGLATVPALIQLPFFAIAVWAVLDAGYGVAGVAAVFVIRNLIDGLILAVLLGRVVPFEGHVAWRQAGLLSTAILIILFVQMPEGLELRLLLAVVCSGAYTLGLWRFGMEARERAWLLGLVRRSH